MMPIPIALIVMLAVLSACGKRNADVWDEAMRQCKQCILGDDVVEATKPEIK